MTNPLDPGHRTGSPMHAPSEQLKPQQISEGQTRKGYRVREVESTSTQGLKPRMLSSVPMQAKFGTRFAISLVRPFASLSTKLFGGKQLPSNVQNDLKTAIDQSDTQRLRHTVEKMTSTDQDSFSTESVSEASYESPNLTARGRDKQMHQQWMDSRLEGEPILFYLAKRGNKAMTEHICRNPDIGLSSLELKSVAGNRSKVIPGDLNKEGLAGYSGSPFAFALDHGNFDTALAMAANGGTLQHGGAKAVFSELKLTPNERAEFRDAFSARESDIETELFIMKDSKGEIENNLQEMREQYGQLISWENPNYANFDNYPEPELSDADWKKIKDQFSALKKVSVSLANPIKILEEQLKNARADLDLVRS